MNMNIPRAGRQPAVIRRMFNDIAPTYDLLNHLLSFGLDIGWRRKAISILEGMTDGALLDIAAGSGDLSLEALRIRPRLVVSTDFAERMLRVFRTKIASRAPHRPISLLACDALRLPFKAAAFDATMVAFGIRNFADRKASLCEMRRVLRPGGMAIILELSTPEQPFVRLLYRMYSRIGLPLVGAVISHHTKAYRYLPDSISEFPGKEEFLGLVRSAGFAEAKAIPLTFGIAMIYVGKVES